MLDTPQQPLAPQNQDGDGIIVTREMRDAGADVIERLRGVVSSYAIAEYVYIAMEHIARAK